MQTDFKRDWKNERELDNELKTILWTQPVTCEILSSFITNRYFPCSLKVAAMGMDCVLRWTNILICSCIFLDFIFGYGYMYKIITLIFFQSLRKIQKSFEVYPCKTLCMKKLCSSLPVFSLMMVHYNSEGGRDLLSWVGTIRLTAILALENTLGCDEEECF